jgi:hypothetical protein
MSQNAEKKWSCAQPNKDSMPGSSFGVVRLSSMQDNVSALNLGKLTELEYLSVLN